MSGKFLLALAGLAALLPAVPALAADGSARLAATVPFHDCDGMICFQASVDGGPPRTLTLDTGDTDSIMLAGAAKAMGWCCRNWLARSMVSPCACRPSTSRWST